MTAPDSPWRAPAVFIALSARWFDEYERGEKTVEYRPYGARWNERTCRVGRPVVLSVGFGKQRRMSGVIVGFSVVDRDADSDIDVVYPDEDGKIAAIQITVDR